MGNYVLLGNSHAQMYAPLWASILAERRQTGLLIPVNSCLPTVTANITPACVETARRNLAEVSRLTRTRLVILGMTWGRSAGELVDPEGHVLANRADADLVAALDDLIARLRAAGKRVVLIGPIAEPGWDIASEYSRELAFGRPVDRPAYVPAPIFMSFYGPALRHFDARRDIGFARPDKVQCDAQRCHYLIDGQSLFADSNHLAQATLPRFRSVFETVLPTPTPAP